MPTYATGLGWDRALERFRGLLDQASSYLLAVTEEESGRRPGPGKWSKKEILGHLIDSAANNHQRFVRGQLEDGLRSPGYAQEDWVAVQRYQERPWKELVELWTAYNCHLLAVLAVMPVPARAYRCTVGDNAPATLEFIMEDYVMHLIHHFKQLGVPV